MTTFNKGDKVRTNDNVFTADWRGIEGTVVEVLYGGAHARIKITKNPPEVYRVGSVITLPATKFDVLVPEAGVPRVVGVSEIRTGDRIRVSYPARVERYAGTVETTTRVREAVVSKIKGSELFDSEDYLINAYWDGLEGAVYELLERPEVEVRTIKTEPVGAQFKALTSNGSYRLLSKVGEDKWTDVFLSSGNAYSADDRMAQDAFDMRKGEWLEVS